MIERIWFAIVVLGIASVWPYKCARLGSVSFAELVQKCFNKIRKVQLLRSWRPSWWFDFPCSPQCLLSCWLSAWQQPPMLSRNSWGGRSVVRAVQWMPRSGSPRRKRCFRLKDFALIVETPYWLVCNPAVGMIGFDRMIGWSKHRGRRCMIMVSI